MKQNLKLIIKHTMKHYSNPSTHNEFELLFQFECLSSPILSSNENLGRNSACALTLLDSAARVPEEEDYMRPCFDVETVQILVARRVMQDLIPKKLTRDYPALLEYINKAEIILKMKTRDEKEYSYMKRAFYDALGGYLYAYTIPVLNEAFYAGKVEYHVANELQHVLRRMMTYLSTNGGQWADPCDMDKIPTKVQALTLNLCLQDQSCDNFIIASDLQQNLEEGEGTSQGNKTNCITEPPKIQLPFLDDDSYPNAIVVPFKEHALFSLMASCTINIVPKYYILAMRCLSHPQFSNEDIIFFNQRLHRWIMTVVLPHLQDTDRFFPGFGGIMRVVETMNKRGLTSTASFKPNMRPLNGSYAIPIDLDEKWYSAYVKKLTEMRALVWECIGIVAIFLALVLFHLTRKAYFDEPCPCDTPGTSKKEDTEVEEEEEGEGGSEKSEVIVQSSYSLYDVHSRSRLSPKRGANKAKRKFMPKSQRY
ncbi:unnamed protein product [Nesidiocoris tenuis]|uniref:Uncharacterized protein n=1 Tax=Nesidiocoris tenuis TaxID=355587 RepID=A0A6H5GW90_9HEMI|nr:unnamed protein product [Nesidiocoris tenuis]